MSGSSSKREAGRNSSGTRNDRPSSPPVNSESCAARMAKAEATARVIMAKKIARTLSENSPISKARTTPAARAMPRPLAAEVQVGPQP